MQKLRLDKIIKITKGKKELLAEKEKSGCRYIQIEDLRNNDNIKSCLPNVKSVHVSKKDIIIAWDGAKLALLDTD